MSGIVVQFFLWRFNLAPVLKPASQASQMLSRLCAWTLLTCEYTLVLCLKLLGHCSHLNSLTVPCVDKWLFKFSLLPNFSAHNSQTNGLFPTCTTFMCCDKWALCLKPFAHNPHVCFLSFVWTSMCISNSMRWKKRFEHFGHSNRPFFKCRNVICLFSTRWHDNSLSQWGHMTFLFDCDWSVPLCSRRLGSCSSTGPSVLSSWLLSFV